jgi:hypothetical protein
MHIEVAYALADKQFLYSLNVAQGTTVEQAIAASTLFKDVPDVEIKQVGIFSRPVSLDTVLREGDRVEVYRPLKADPRERRRREVEAERQQA